MNNKPQTIEEIHAAATVMFRDKSVSSIIIEASFGTLEIYRNELFLYVDSDFQD